MGEADSLIFLKSPPRISLGNPSTWSRREEDSVFGGNNGREPTSGDGKHDFKPIGCVKGGLKRGIFLRHSDACLKGRLGSKGGELILKRSRSSQLWHWSHVHWCGSG